MGQHVLVDIHPPELKFVFELKKQCSCSIQLLNKTDKCIAFKVKTTSPKRYCVRPNVGIIQPSSTCDFTVTMQAQKEIPLDMQLKDKFLVQTTIVPFETTDEDIVPSFFSKENGRYIQENKMRVALVSPPESPVESVDEVPEPSYPSVVPENAYGAFGLNENSSDNSGALKDESIQVTSLKVNSNTKELAYEGPIVKRTSSVVLKQEPEFESLLSKNTSISTDQTVAIHLPSLDVKALDNLNSKLESLEGKLNVAERTIVRQREDNYQIIQEKEKLEQDIVLLRKKYAHGAKAGFPFLFVVFVSLASMALGCLLRI